MNDKLTRVAHRISSMRVAISYKQYFNQYMRYNSPFREMVEDEADLEVPNINSSDEDFEKYYTGVANKLLRPEIINKIKTITKKPQEKIPVNVFRKIPLIDSILFFASNIVHKFSSDLEAKLKAKYGRR